MNEEGRKKERKSEKKDINYNTHLFWVSEFTILFGKR